MHRSAIFSPCLKYRYSLSRVWNPKLPTVVFVGLNPSTADEQEDDPTVRRCIAFARKWHFGSLNLVNLFAYRSTDPTCLTKAEDPVGPENDAHIVQSVVRAKRVVIAWGTKGTLLSRDRQVLSLLPDSHCLGITKEGYPKHPLYLAGNTRVRLFRAVLTDG